MKNVRVHVQLSDGRTIVVVSAVRSFRVEDAPGLQVYSQNRCYFSEHLLNVPAARMAALLESNSKPEPSLVDINRLHRPIVVVDEAHDARTGLSFSTLGDLLPS